MVPLKTGLRIKHQFDFRRSRVSAPTMHERNPIDILSYINPYLEDVRARLKRA